MKKKLRGASTRTKELNLLIRTAALTISQNASINAVSTKAGLGSAAVRAAIKRGYFTIGQASALELAFGPKLLTKEQLIKPAE